MLEFLKIVGGVSVANIICGLAAFALVSSKFYQKWCMKLVTKFYDFDEE